MRDPHPEQQRLLWSAPPWRICLETAEGTRWVQLDRPFALIGNHPRCDIRVGGVHSPPVAYFACCFPGSVEVWPTAAIAFPRWGVVQAQHQLLVGRHRISLHHSSGRSDERAQTLPDPGITTSLVWDGIAHEKVLRRPVTIIGEDHPSVVRVHGQGLERCDRALVAQDGMVWIVDLVPSRWGPDPIASVIHLSSTSDVGHIGGATIRLAPGATSVGLDGAAHASALTQPIPHQFAARLREYQPPHVLGKRPADSDSDLFVGEGTTASLAGFAERKSPPARGSATGLRWGHSSQASSGLVHAASRSRAWLRTIVDAGKNRFSKLRTESARWSETPREGRPIERSDVLTSRITNRLVSISQARLLRRRMLYGALSLTGATVAMVAVARLGSAVYHTWFGG